MKRRTFMQMAAMSTATFLGLRMLHERDSQFFMLCDNPSTVNISGHRLPLHIGGGWPTPDNEGEYI